MGNLLINANNTDGATEFEVGYRVYGSNAAFTIVQPNSATLPVTVPNVPNNRYESSVRKKCTNGIWSDPEYGVSAPCAAPLSFSVVQNGKNWSVSWILGSGQTKFNIEVTDPNGGVQNLFRTDGNQGTVSIAMNPVMAGGWRFRLQGVCDETVAPVFASDFTQPISVTVDQTSVCAAPTAPAVSAITNTTALISANPPADVAGVQGYVLTYQDVATGIPITLNAAIPSFNVVGLQPGHSYAYTIQSACSGNANSTPVYGGTFTTTNI